MDGSRASMIPVTFPMDAPPIARASNVTVGDIQALCEVVRTAQAVMGAFHETGVDIAPGYKEDLDAALEPFRGDQKGEG